LKFAERMDELKRQWHAVRQHHPRLVLGVAASLLLVAVVSTVGGIWSFVGLRDGLPDQAAMRRIGEMDQATAVFDRNDRLAFTIFKEQRIDVPLSKVSPNLTKAITAIEDQRFFEHHGFDLVRIASAALANVRHNRRAQGGSTITQQLARQSFLTPNKSYRRKLQELILAARLERLYTKQQILELYFNKVYFGDGLYGVEAASRGFFGKHASEVTVAEAALLAGLVKSPSSYAPTVSVERAVARRNTVLQAMLDAGAIDKATYQSARVSKPALHDTLREEEQLYLERHGKMPPAGRYDKRLVRIKVRISSRDPNLKHWPRWAKKRLQPDWYEALNQTGGGKAETWYLYFGDSGCGLYCRRGSQASTGVTRTPIEARRGRSCPFPHLSRNQYRTTAGMCEKPVATDA